MWKFILRRILALIPVLLGVTLFVFVILAVAPGDPARTVLGFEATQEAIDELREEMGLNDPILVRYFRYLGDLLHGDMGNSYKTGFSVTSQIAQRLPNTLRLMAASIMLSVVIAIPLGILAALKQNSIFDALSMTVSLLGISLPSFWVGLILILLFSVRLGILPSSGSDGILTMVLPVLTLSLNGLSSIARTTRSSMLEIINADYIRTAKSKGLSKREVIVKHAIQNTFIPILTVVGIQMCFMISGTILVESVFAWPGMGRLLVSAIGDRDIPIIMGCVIVFAVCFSIINLLTDLMYAVVDPRVKAQYRKGV